MLYIFLIYTFGLFSIDVTTLFVAVFFNYIILIFCSNLVQTKSLNKSSAELNHSSADVTYVYYDLVQAKLFDGSYAGLNHSAKLTQYAKQFALTQSKLNYPMDYMLTTL